MKAAGSGLPMTLTLSSSVIAEWPVSFGVYMHVDVGDCSSVNGALQRV